MMLAFSQGPPSRTYSCSVRSQKFLTSNVAHGLEEARMELSTLHPSHSINIHIIVFYAELSPPGLKVTAARRLSQNLGHSSREMREGRLLDSLPLLETLYVIYHRPKVLDRALKASGAFFCESSWKAYRSPSYCAPLLPIL